MPTLKLLPQTSMKGSTAFDQPPQDVTDLDGWRELSLFVNASRLSFDSGAGTTSTPFQVTLLHAPRNQDDDFRQLDNTFEFYSSGDNAAVAYVTQFSRFVKVQAEFLGTVETSTCSLEVLAVPKK